MSKNLYIVVGLPGSGKSTYLHNKINDGIIVSRDDIRVSLINETSGYFDNEKEVFNRFVKEIQVGLDSSNNVNVFADATNINEKSRNKLLNRLKLKGVKIHTLFIYAPLEVCIERNNKREGVKRLPEIVIKNFNDKLEIPSHNEKYKYKSLMEVRNF